MKHISRTVLILSAVSLFTDMASEMLYPILPIYLQKIGFSILLIGILEGIAEAVAGLSKGYFGQLSDSKAKRAPFIQAGYALSAVSKPMLAFFAYPLYIVAVRALDRVGKGIRTGARDALLSAEATPEKKATVFGFHRAMDTLGAVLGPLLALLYLYYRPEDYINLFYIAFIPGILAVLASFLLKDKPPIKPKKKQIHFFSFLKYWKNSPLQYRKLTAGLLFFAFFNSSDVFLLLKAKEAGLSDTFVIGVYIFYNFIFALFAFPLGRLADTFGLKKMYIVGLALFCGVYVGMAKAESLYIIISLFFGYGLYAAATEGISKAWISNTISKENTATAIGTFSALQSIASLFASTGAGLLWYFAGAKFTFLVTGFATLVAICYFLLLKKTNYSEASN